MTSKQTMTEKVRAALTREWQSAMEVSEMSGVEYAKTNQRIQLGIRSGKVEAELPNHTPHQRYRLTSPTPPTTRQPTRLVEWETWCRENGSNMTLKDYRNALRGTEQETNAISDVYEKFKHLDGCLSDPHWCNTGHSAIYGIAGEMWRAIKKETLSK